MSDYKGNFYSDAYGNHVKRLDVDFLTASSCGKSTVSSSEATAGTKDIEFDPEEMVGMDLTSRAVIVTVTRGGIDMHSFKLTISKTLIKVQTNSTDFVLTAGDVITYIIM